MIDEKKTKEELISELQNLRLINAGLSADNEKLGEEIIVLRQARDTLMANDQQLRAIIENAEEVIYTLSCTGEFLFVSPAWTHIIGHPVNEVIGKNFTPFVHPDDVQTCYDFLNLVYRTGLPQKGVQYRVKSTGGDWLWFTSAGTAIKDDDGNPLYYMGVALNITEHKRIEEELTFRNLILSTQQETAIDGILVVGKEASILSYNHKFALMWGIPEEILATKSDKLALNAVLDRLPEPEQFLTKVNYLYEHTEETSFDEILLKDGRIFERYSAPMIGSDGIYRGRVWYFRDITERRRVEMELQKESSTLRDFIELNPYSIQLLDRNGFTIKANRSLIKLFGAVPPSDYTVFDDPVILDKGLQKDLCRVLDGEIVCFPEFHYNVRQLGPDFPDTPLWIRMVAFPILGQDGKVENFALMHENVTERKLAEERLRLFQESVESSFDAIGMSTPDGKHFYQNRAFSDLFGHINEKSPVSVYVDEHTGKEVFNTIMEGGQWSGEVEMYSKDRSILNIFLRAYASKDAEGHVTNLVGIHSDITQHKKIEKERHNMELQLLQAQKMESIGRLAGGLAHDFNNMLMVIFFHIGEALAQVSLDNPVYKDLEAINNASRRSANLIRQLLAFARQQTVSPRVIDLNEIVGDMFRMLRRLIGEDIELQWKPSAGLWYVKVDPVQIDQILANLCVNARDSISDTGRITIETGNVTFDDAYCSLHAGYIPGDYVMLSVSDTGYGMEKHVVEHIFEPFFTTKEIGKGTGLGLATVYGIVIQNNGFIHVDSEPGKGTIFNIYMPRFSEELMKTSDIKAAEGGHRGGETVLLVEDELSVMNVSRIILESMGYRVLAANTPEQAINMAREHRGEIHLLLTDVVMPGMNGRELAKKIKAL
ncbi:MAG: PAS domain S-box protein, partial [Candidatus Eremiobacterota bacterium]